MAKAASTSRCPTAGDNIGRAGVPALDETGVSDESPLLKLNKREFDCVAWGVAWGVVGVILTALFLILLAPRG